MMTIAEFVMLALARTLAEHEQAQREAQTELVQALATVDGLEGLDRCNVLRRAYDAACLRVETAQGMLDVARETYLAMNEALAKQQAESNG